jgi:cation diffusion facilitator family transporter
MSFDNSAPIPSAADRANRAIRAARAGLLINIALVLVKLIGGILGNAYVLVADAVESMTDVFSSLVVWGGLHFATLPADENHPYGHGKAEPLATAVVSLALMGAAVGVAVAALREIRMPHHLPAPWTLFIAAGVAIIKYLLARRVNTIADAVGSGAVKADAWHHASDALTSVAAVLGIGIALLGGPGWERADDFAALAAALVIFVNGVHLLRPAVHDLMDRAPSESVRRQIGDAALAVPGVCAIEQLRVRSAGLDFSADLHVQADPVMTLHDAHELSGRVKGAIRNAVPRVAGVLVHMEPYHATGQCGPEEESVERQAASVERRE